MLQSLWTTPLLSDSFKRRGFGRGDGLLGIWSENPDQYGGIVMKDTAEALTAAVIFLTLLCLFVGLGGAFYGGD